MVSHSMVEPCMSETISVVCGPSPGAMRRPNTSRCRDAMRHQYQTMNSSATATTATAPMVPLLPPDEEGGGGLLAGGAGGGGV